MFLHCILDGYIGDEPLDDLISLTRSLVTSHVTLMIMHVPLEGLAVLTNTLILSYTVSMYCVCVVVTLPDV